MKRWFGFAILAFVAGCEGSAPHAAALLVAEGDDGAPADTLDRLDARDDAQSAVELAALRHRVEMGAGPHLG